MDQRDTWKSVRQQLLDLHKLLLDGERAKYEREHEPIGSPGAFLQLVLGNEQFAWLRELSGLIVQFDEALSLRKPATAEEGEALMSKTRELLTGASATSFTEKYREALASDRNAEELHRSLLKALSDSPAL